MTLCTISGRMKGGGNRGCLDCESGGYCGFVICTAVESHATARDVPSWGWDITLRVAMLCIDGTMELTRDSVFCLQ